ncbi:MAG: Crp/Fnr family transcriptional regulator [Crocinitomicaceae bacterium]
MINAEEQKELIKERIGFLFDEELTNEFLNVGRLQSVKEGDQIISTGDEIVMMPFIIDGAIKVSRVNDDGEELLLYYIESGDTCAMTLQCCVRKTKSEIKAIALEDSKLLMIPIEYMEAWMNKYHSWRSFVLSSYHNRFQELMETVDAIAFMRLDERLDKYLKDQAKLLGTLEIHYTHQRIAEDLHSSRVVISRLLKQMEVKGLITLRRNNVILKEF